MDNDNYATVTESVTLILSLQVVQVDTKKIVGLDDLILAKKRGISPKKALIMIHCTTVVWDKQSTVMS